MGNFRSPGSALVPEFFENKVGEPMGDRDAQDDEQDSEKAMYLYVATKEKVERPDKYKLGRKHDEPDAHEQQESICCSVLTLEPFDDATL